jgi:uncharacterized Fe-S cluster protein YjdI
LLSHAARMRSVNSQEYNVDRCEETIWMTAFQCEASQVKSTEAVYAWCPSGAMG